MPLTQKTPSFDAFCPASGEKWESATTYFCYNKLTLMKKKNTETLRLDTFYHVYNRGTNGQDVFIEVKNYQFFLDRLAK
jgi:hypothetical protein